MMDPAAAANSGFNKAGLVGKKFRSNYTGATYTVLSVHAGRNGGIFAECTDGPGTFDVPLAILESDHYAPLETIGANMSNVESPNHYTQGYMEVVYEIRDTLGHEGFKAFCMGNWMKYNARANHKGLKSEDLAKADQYLEWAANGLPKPVNNRVPRPEQGDLYEQAAQRIFKRDPLAG